MKKFIFITMGLNIKFLQNIILKKGKAEVLFNNTEKYITLITCNQNRNGYQVVLIGKLVSSIEY